MHTHLAQHTMADQFRAAFGNHPAGVAIVTATGEFGPAGITASSVISVAADPALVAFNVAGNHGSASAILEAKTFLIHLLTAENAELATRFAMRGNERFSQMQNWEFLETGEPLINGLGTVLRCEIHSKTPAGPATLIIASVLEVIGSQSSAAPLVYHQRGYHSIGEHSRLTA